MVDFEQNDLTSVEPAEFAKLIKSTPDKKLAEVMSGDQRSPILAEIFRRIPSMFRADRAGATSTVIHWVIGGRPDGGSDTYQLVIDQGACTTSATPDREPKLTLSMGAVEFLKVISGAGNPMMMFMTGKVKAKGDLGLAANFANLFTIPKS